MRSLFVRFFPWGGNLHDDSTKGKKVRANAALSAAAVLNARWNGFSSAGSFSIKLHLFLSLRNAPDASLISSYWPALLPLQFLIRIAVSILRVMRFFFFSLSSPPTIRRFTLQILPTGVREVLQCRLELFFYEFLDTRGNASEFHLSFRCSRYFDRTRIVCLRTMRSIIPRDG